jgi:hypothetical protein
MSQVFNNTKLRIEKNTIEIMEITILLIITQLYIIFTKGIEDYKEIKEFLNLNLLNPPLISVFLLRTNKVKPHSIKYHLVASK